MQFFTPWAIFLTVFLMTTHSAAQEPSATKLKVVVAAGGHGYEKQPFQAIFPSYDDMEITFIDEVKGGEVLDYLKEHPCDVLVLYNYKRKSNKSQRKQLLKLLDDPIGLVIMHHAIYGYKPWEEWPKIVGYVKPLDSSKDDIHYTIHVEQPNHPITQGMTDFEIKDETYHGYEIDPSVNLILTTDEPLNAKQIAWTHTYRRAPVFYLQSGHGPSAYANEQVIKVLGNGIRWAAAEAARTRSATTPPETPAESSR